MKVLVYGLSSTEDNLIRYIGQTTQSISARLRQHKSDSRLRYKNRYVCKWIRSVWDRGYEIKAIVLNDDAVLHETEKEIIAEYKQKGFKLVNLTEGGEGTIGYSPPYRPRPDLSKRNKEMTGCKRAPLSEEHKLKVSVGNKGKSKPWLAERNKRNTGKPGRKQTEGERHRRSLSLKGRVITPEWREKLSQAARRRHVKGV